MDVTEFTMADTPMMTLIKRSIFFGLVAILAGYAASYIVKPYFKTDLPEVCKSWNKKHLMEASLFVTGFILFFGIHYFGVRY